MNYHYDTRISSAVRFGAGGKLFHISVRNGTPYITYKRKTRVLFKSPTTGAYINVEGSRVYFL